MTDGPEQPEIQPEEREQAFLAVEPGYKNVLRLRMAMSWLPLIFGAIFLERLLEDSIFYGFPSMAVPLIALVSIALAPQRIYRHLRYRLGERLLQVLRGWMFHSDTIVPFVRVQHMDVTRGPLDKMFGTATLVIHTAGTHNSIVTVPGLAPARAEEIREIIREHVRSDFA